MIEIQYDYASLELLSGIMLYSQSLPDQWIFLSRYHVTDYCEDTGYSMMIKKVMVYHLQIFEFSRKNRH